MTTPIIRDAIIRLKLELAKSKLEAPEIEKVTRAYDSEQKSARESTKAVRESTAAKREHAQVSRESAESSSRAMSDLRRNVTGGNYEMVASFREGGEGALRMARGIAFLSASGSDDLRRLVQTVA